MLLIITNEMIHTHTHGNSHRNNHNNNNGTAQQTNEGVDNWIKQGTARKETILTGELVRTCVSSTKRHTIINNIIVRNTF
mmetsp:Transcript_43021/g.48694  ORF Transcript_43021/g.48694 Transcript_43021/m.48694 type:complete len:80 (-) Transcript_43021:19-258(-)